MKQLFTDITKGLVTQGWKVHGGNDDNFLILQKDGDAIKVFANNYREPTHFVVRYSVKAEGKEKK